MLDNKFNEYAEQATKEAESLLFKTEAQIDNFLKLLDENDDFDE